MAKSKTKKEVNASVEEKLRALYNLQKVNSNIDNIKKLRGELPLEVQDLEDELAGLETRINKYTEEIDTFKQDIAEKKNKIEDSNVLIVKYTEQQNNVRNNREFDSLSKEIEFQSLEIELCEKRIREAKANIKSKQDIIDNSADNFQVRKDDLLHKKDELDDIINETQKDEEKLGKDAIKIEGTIEERLLTAYKRIRANARNGLSLVTVERDACGGCFNKIPPQRQLDIRSRKKIIVCEYCGRILVDKDIELSLGELEAKLIADAEKAKAEEKPKRRRKVKETK